MLNDVEQAKQSWGGSYEVIDNWLNARQSLLVQYCELAGSSQKTSTSSLPTEHAIEVFCESLVDYVSAGHFEIYDKLADQLNGTSSSSATQPDSAKQLLDKLVPDITATTEQALRFNDLYADTETPPSYNAFDSHLEELGEALEERFALEDRLIGTLHSHQA